MPGLSVLSTLKEGGPCLVGAGCTPPAAVHSASIGYPAHLRTSIRGSECGRFGPMGGCGAVWGCVRGSVAYLVLQRLGQVEGGIRPADGHPGG